MSDAITFHTAITRIPALSAVDGLRAHDSGNPDMGTMLGQHRDYLLALKQAGVVVVELPPLEDFPDAQFVEDTALCLTGLAIMMRPGAETRRGEVPPMRDALALIFDEIADIEKGFIEAGDILVTDREVIVGRSQRTDDEGINNLHSILQKHGFAMRVVDTPHNVLHFKTDCGLVAENTVISTKRLASSGCFDEYDVLQIPNGEEAAANMIRVNDHIIMPADFPETKAMLVGLGYNVITVGNTECAKIDGGMSCLSLRI